MPFCQAPIQNFILNENGKCGKKIVSNNYLHLCKYHMNILRMDPQHPIKSFSPTNNCLGCKKDSEVFLYDYGFCDTCMPNHKASNLNITNLLDFFVKNPNIVDTCDKKIIYLFKDMLEELDNSLPRNFSFAIDYKNNIIIIKDRNNIIVNAIKYDENYNLYLEKDNQTLSFI